MRSALEPAQLRVLVAEGVVAAGDRAPAPGQPPHGGAAGGEGVAKARGRDGRVYALVACLPYSGAQTACFSSS